MGLKLCLEVNFVRIEICVKRTAGGTKRLVSVNICSVEGNSAGIFVSKVSPGLFVIKVKWMPIIFEGMKLPFWVR